MILNYSTFSVHRGLEDPRGSVELNKLRNDDQRELTVMMTAFDPELVGKYFEPFFHNLSVEEAVAGAEYRMERYEFELL